MRAHEKRLGEAVVGSTEGIGVIVPVQQAARGSRLVARAVLATIITARLVALVRQSGDEVGQPGLRTTWDSGWR